MKVRKKDMTIMLEAYSRWAGIKKTLKSEVKKNSTLYYTLRETPSELQVIACGWGDGYYKNVKKYLTSLRDLRLEVSGETLKEMGYKPSGKFRVVLGKLFEMKLDGKVKSREDEVSQLERLMAAKQINFKPSLLFYLI